MSHAGQIEASYSTIPAPIAEETHWYAVRTRPRHEKKVVAELREKGITTYLPLMMQMSQWSDRRKKIQVPLFSCYAFVYSAFDLHLRLSVYGISGALGFVGPNNEGIPIPDEQIESIRTLLASSALLTPYPLLKTGQRVRIRGGALNGVEGILVTKGDRRLVISVEAINVSLSFSLQGYHVEPI